MKRSTPPKWDKAMKAKGISSATALATKAGVATTSVTRIMHGDGDSDGATITAIANVLADGDRNVVLGLMGSSRRDYGDYKIPDDAFLLTPSQRKALEVMVAAMVHPEDGETREGKKPTRGAHRTSGAAVRPRQSQRPD